MQRENIQITKSAAATKLSSRNFIDQTIGICECVVNGYSDLDMINKIRACLFNEICFCGDIKVKHYAAAALCLMTGSSLRDFFSDARDVSIANELLERKDYFTGCCEAFINLEKKKND